MDPIYDLLKITIPAGIVLYAMFLVIRTFLQKQNEEKLILLKTKNREISLPLRLQAYERMCLFLERINPDQLISRVQRPDQNVAELQLLLLREVREEFNHNLSQQVYMSIEAWNTIKSAKEETIMLINQAANSIEKEEKGILLAKSIYEIYANKNADSIAYSLEFLKTEIQSDF